MDNHSIDNFKGEKKSKFTVALNIAYDNCSTDGKCDIRKVERLLREAQHSKGGISDSQITAVLPDICTRLKNVRNYFSHYYHQEQPLYFDTNDPAKTSTKQFLYFDANDPVKVFLEDAFNKAVENLRGKIISNEYQLIVPPLFVKNQNNYTITAPGVIFLASFFCHRSYAYRMISGISGFKRADKKVFNDGQKIDYGFTRKLLSFYSLRDSYCVNTVENKELAAFRDILGYLSRVPEEAIKWLIEKGKLTKDEAKQFYLTEQNDEQQAEQKTEVIRYSLRKTDKFLLFAVRFIEDWAEQGNIKVEFARYEKNPMDAEGKKQDEKEKRVVRFVSEEPAAKNWPYYIRNEHAVIRITPNGKSAVSARISENELKYLVLAILDNKGTDAIKNISDHIFNMKNWVSYKSYGAGAVKYIPAFVIKDKTGSNTVTKTEIDKRVKYINDEIDKVIADIQKEQEKQKDEQKKPVENRTWLVYKGKKIAIILKYVNDCIEVYKNRLSVKEYNELRGYLQELNFKSFYNKLAEYQHSGRLPNRFVESINKINGLSELCVEVCGRQKKKLAEMAVKGGVELQQYIGLAPKEGNPKESVYSAKAEKFIKLWLSIPENFLRRKFYDKYCQHQDCKNNGSDAPENTNVLQRKYFIDIIKEKGFKPIHKEKYYLLEENPKDYERPDGKVIRQLCDVYCKDSLCMAMAKWYYTNRLKAFENIIKWQTGDDNQQQGYAGHWLEYQATEKIKIHFKLADFTRLDIIEKPEMLKNICEQWETELLKAIKNGKLNWYDFKKNGFENYRKWQGGVVADIFWFEDSLKINDTQWQGQSHIPFNLEKEHPQWCNILDEAVKQSQIATGDKDALSRVRNDCFHENFLANTEQRKIFETLISDRAKAARPKAKKTQKNKQKYGKR